MIFHDGIFRDGTINIAHSTYIKKKNGKEPKDMNNVRKPRCWMWVEYHRIKKLREIRMTAEIRR